MRLHKNKLVQKRIDNYQKAGWSIKKKSKENVVLHLKDFYEINIFFNKDIHFNSKPIFWLVKDYKNGHFLQTHCFFFKVKNKIFMLEYTTEEVDSKMIFNTSLHKLTFTGFEQLIIDPSILKNAERKVIMTVFNYCRNLLERSPNYRLYSATGQIRTHFSVLRNDVV